MQTCPRITLLGLFCATTIALSAPLPIPSPTVTCTGGAQVISIPEGTEASVGLTCPSFVLPAAVDGTVAVMLDSTGAVSDLVGFSNTNGAATFVFVSDIEGTSLTTPAGVPILTVVSEPTPVVVVATSTTAGTPNLSFTFSSDVNESTDISDTISVATVPEPSSLGLIAIGAGLLLGRRFLG